MGSTLNTQSKEHCSSSSNTRLQGERQARRIRQGSREVEPKCCFFASEAEKELVPTRVVEPEPISRCTYATCHLWAQIGRSYLWQETEIFKLLGNITQQLDFLEKCQLEPIFKSILSNIKLLELKISHCWKSEIVGKGQARWQDLVFYGAGCGEGVGGGDGGEGISIERHSPPTGHCRHTLHTANIVPIDNVEEEEEEEDRVIRRRKEGTSRQQKGGGGCPGKRGLSKLVAREGSPIISRSSHAGWASPPTTNCCFLWHRHRLGVLLKSSHRCDHLSKTHVLPFKVE